MCIRDRLKASLILKGLNAMNSIGELSSIDANAAQADITELISLIENEMCIRDSEVAMMQRNKIILWTRASYSVL